MTLLNSATMDLELDGHVENTPFKSIIESDDVSNLVLKSKLQKLVRLAIHLGSMPSLSLDAVQEVGGGLMSQIYYLYSILQSRCIGFVWSAVSLDVGISICERGGFCDIIKTVLDTPETVLKNGMVIDELLKSGKSSILICYLKNLIHLIV